jgi:outer membrane protein OmpA-like peptidoglycan-associated protein
MLDKKIRISVIALFLVFSFCSYSQADRLSREERRKQEFNELQNRFEWWPTDAKPGPVKDPERGGYWWWPTEPGKARPWGNRGYVYVYKIIFDYKEEELPPPKPQELRPSLLIKKIIKNVKIYFDYDKASLREDAKKILSSAVGTLQRNPEASILITGNCDRRGSEAYNEKLGRRRGEAVKKFMLDNGIAEEHIKIISRGKLDAVAPITDLVGMQKDRNAQFMIAEVEEVMLPYPGEPEAAEARKVEEGKYIIEEEKKMESEVKVSTKEYTIQKGDTLSKIAKEQLGAAHRWKYLYELNKNKIKDPNKLKPGRKLIIPIE